MRSDSHRDSHSHESTATAEAQRLLEAAVQAARIGDDTAALALLQRSVKESRFNPIAHYLLGAEYAQRQQYGDAVLHMTTAVEQAPELWIARLQLGLLWLTLGNPASAQAQLQPLSRLPEGDVLRRFGDALAALCRDDLRTAVEQLRAGLLTGSDNAPLMADMRRLLSAVEERLSASGAATAAQAIGDARAGVSHGMAISAYTRRGLDS